MIAPGQAVAADPTWLPEIRVEAAQTAIYGLSCASVTTCVAAAGAGPVIQDGDVPTYPDTDPDPAHSLTDVSCAPATKFCMFVDDSGNAFTLNDGSFSALTDIDGTLELHEVSCPTATFCMAIDQNRNVLKYQNGTWGSPTPLTGGGTYAGYPHVSCPSVSFCMAVAYTNNSGTYGTVYYTYNGTWSGVSAQFNNDSTDGYPVGLSCTSATFCVVTDDVGQALVTTTAPGSARQSRSTATTPIRDRACRASEPRAWPSTSSQLDAHDRRRRLVVAAGERQAERCRRDRRDQAAWTAPRRRSAWPATVSGR